MTEKRQENLQSGHSDTNDSQSVFSPIYTVYIPKQFCIGATFGAETFLLKIRKIYL